MNRLRLYQPSCYRLVVGGHSSAAALALPYTLTCCHGRSAGGVPLSTMEGLLPDQAALHGVLAQIRDRGQPLYLVQCLDLL